MSIELSVILCTHNPRADYLERTLAGLRRQTLAFERWELVLVDNHSTPPLAERMDVSWHPSGRVVVEEKLGLIHARLRGFGASAGEIVVCVDDDNVLSPDFLQCALDIARQRPYVGAWGGSLLPEWEATPDMRWSPFFDALALREVKTAAWSNFSIDSCPFGAGLCLRRTVIDAYVRSASGSEVRLSLGRRGNELLGGEDLDIAMTSYRLGLGTGLFPELEIVHLISKGRLSPDYLYRIKVGGTYSYFVANYLHYGTTIARLRAPSPWIRLLRLLKLIAGRRPGVLHARAVEEAEAKFYRFTQRLESKPRSPAQ